MITRSDIAAHLERNIRTGFLLGRKDYTPLRSGFMGVRPSDGAFEDYADMGTVPWPVQNSGKQGAGGTHGETGAEKVGQAGAGGAITVIGAPEQAMRVYNVNWQVALGIEHDAIDDDRAGDLESWARSARTQFERHMDFLAFDMLNAGEGTTYGRGYDHLSFFNDSHFDPGAEYQTAQDNKFALTLSLDNFQTVKVAASKFRDDRGQPLGLNHNVLVVPPDLEYIGMQITKNPEAFDTANRERNPYSGSVGLLVAPGGWLDSTAWFLLDPSLPQKPMYMQERQAPELVIWDDESQGSGVRYFKWEARYIGFYGDWRTAAIGNT
ncbi:MAG: Mu-like prophage major head subunit gpT family protein [Acidimicrobiales bacterium]